MKNAILIFSLYLLFPFFIAEAKSSDTKNIGFETGTFKGWTGYTWLYYGTDNGAAGTKTSKVQVSLPTSRRQVIISDTTAYDANTGKALKKVPKGYKYSARLGDEIISSDGRPRGWEQSLQYKLTVDSTNSLLIMKFACVLQYASDHTALMEPRFKLTLYDDAGNTINTCTNYDVYASSGNVTGFQTYNASAVAGQPASVVKWRDWTTVGADLSAYKGQSITVEFMSADCTGQYHYGYAYFVADTQPMYIGVQYCSGDSKATLIAPDGFLTYNWLDSNGAAVGTNRVLEVKNPVEGALYQCQLTSATGCQVTLSATILRYEPSADFKYDLVDCNNETNTMRFSNTVPPTHGTLEYKWDFHDGTSSTEKNPTHLFKTSGLHPVSLMVSNPPSTCTDSMMKMVETFYPPMIGISGDSTYCEGGTTTLKAYGAYRYQWSDGSTGDSIRVGKDTTVWMIGYSSVGCYTDTIRFKVRKAPEWVFSASGDSIYCQGASTTLTASGAKKYNWSSGEHTSSIVVKKPGIYTVTGINEYKCQKSVSFNIIEDPLPNVNFSLSKATVDARHNSLTCSIPEQTGVVYNWDMGDGSTQTGTTVTHTYQVQQNTGDYKISLSTTNSNGCSNKLTKTVDIVPFIPNIFSPNGDGINDIFVAGMQLQVYDRYGQKLYEGNTGWDGTFNGRKLDNDTYFYRITYTDKNNQLVSLRGYVTLKK